jgi:hypothetical protein
VPFIGRLDEQVDDVLISLVSKRRRDESHTPTQDEEPPAAPTQTPAKDESSAKTDELPVWLL